MYDVTISAKALKFLKKLHDPIKRRVTERIDLFASEPEDAGKPLTKNLKGLYGSVAKNLEGKIRSPIIKFGSVAKNMFR